ncbi:MAG: CehA/McbA family metallohydrolase [Candidatus Hydrogenedentales bacterium]
MKTLVGPAKPALLQGGWRNFLIKVHNEAGARSQLVVHSPNAAPELHASSGQPRPKPEHVIAPGELEQRFIEAALYTRQMMSDHLSGAPVEYKILQLYTNERGPRDVTLGFSAGAGTEDLAARNSVALLFDCEPSVKLILRVRDEDGAPAMASFIFQDNVKRLAADQADYRHDKAANEPWNNLGIETTTLGTVYPLPARRVAETDEFPDFFFQPQIYRQDGEHVYLPAGTYTVTWTRGPEYLPQTREITVPPDVEICEETFNLSRWVHLAELGWYSGDHHVHAAGCSHYESPQAGVNPEAMFRQALGEDLNVACVLTWGPCWYHQKTYFDGETHELSKPANLMRYDVEVSGFPSSHAGHICLLRLTEDDYPGTTEIEQWPSWGLPVLQWGKQQGGVTGYAHSGWGLGTLEPTVALPNYEMPAYDGIGANEYIVTVTHDAVDFISAGDTPYPWELNIWYHTLNCGFRTAISGETDFPCIFDDRIGMARSYARLDELNFDAFADAVRDGEVYVSDGRSHILDFAVDGHRLSTDGREIDIADRKLVNVSARVAAYLPEDQSAAGAKIAEGGPIDRPYWHLERARIGSSRRVAVELVVNGNVADTKEIDADGQLREVSFPASIPRSSWVALRILPSSHTNPLFVLRNGDPIRASRKSAEWCRAGVDRCWQMKSPRIREAELPAAKTAYDHARATYERIAAEAFDDTN